MRWRVVICLLLSGTVGVVVGCWFGHELSSIRTSAFSTQSPFRASAADTTKVAKPANPRLAQPVPTGRLAFRLANTTKTLPELISSPRAILLENALLDTTAPIDLPIPSGFRAAPGSGSYIVQSQSRFDEAFRQLLLHAGARIIAYIPNNSYLVRLENAAAATLSSNSAIAAILPYEPYYKLKASLFPSALSQDAASSVQPLSVNVLFFEGSEQATLEQIRGANLEVLAPQSSPFGPFAQVRCPGAMLPWLAGLPGVQEIEPSLPRVWASDLSRTRLGVATDPVTTSNYLGLTGSNVLVNVNDLGVDASHPDLSGRVFSDVAAGAVDTNGHGTFVAGLIAGNGGQSLTVANAPGSPLPPAPAQFRGLAPNAHIFSIAVGSESRTLTGDGYLQQTAAANKALISNNSWHYAQDEDYDLGAASYDAAVRDALPAITGSQPLLCVFAAGNIGRGADDGTGGIPDTIQSPGTAKNVITVGAIEQLRLITNQTWTCASNGASVTCHTNTPWLPLTDSASQVASFSSRGNVAPGIEGPAGRFKPDLVAPGTFLVSTRSTAWNQDAYYSTSNNFYGVATDENSPQVLSNLNNALGPFYRFETGTSLAVAQVSGMLALMQEFFERRLSRTNSPALMKALLINGARSLAGGYALHPSTNAQGWGVPQLPNSLPAALTNAGATASSLWLFDQSPLDALSTGQLRTRIFTLNPAAQTLPLRVTLAWTDPPGNPVAGLKLVNDLDLIVTNLDNGEAFWGNDISAGDIFNAASQPGISPNRDQVNNVENVFLTPTLGTHYSVTVLGRRIGVNAVTELPVGLAQDYALVVSSGDGQVTNALTVLDAPMLTATGSVVSVVTNNFAPSGSEFGALLLHQRVSGNAPASATNSIPFPGATNAIISIGSPDQWHFYVFTNATAFTNAVFLTFLAQPLSLFSDGGGAVGSASSGLPWPAAADLDLYVSRDSGLTNLDPAVLAAADVSLGRQGSETIIYSNASPGIYYIGVKCESLQGAEYGFLADVAELPFAQIDSFGNETLRGFPAPAVSPTGTARYPGVNYLFYVTPDDFPVRRVIVTNSLSYSSLADVRTVLAHGSLSVVLNDHSTNAAGRPQPFVYDDTAERDIPGAMPSDGPGSLNAFSGNDGGGQWLMSLATSNQPATIQSSSLFLERQQDLMGNIGATILPQSCREDFLSVPLQATNLTAVVSLVAGTGPISIEVYPSCVSASNCAILIVSSSTSGAITVDQFSQPPLNPGPYVIRTCNLGPDPASVTIQATLVPGQSVPSPLIYSAAAQSLIPDDALCFSALAVTNSGRTLSVEVGVRIDHPRISDLAISLVGPDGTRVLLEAGRGGASSAGLGGNLLVTNTTPVSFSGGPEAVTNIFETGETSGTISINYDFFSLPDEMRIYYEDRLLFDSGLVSFAGSTNIDYGPGAASFFTVVMNQGGNSQSNTAWFYSVTSTRIEPLFFTFTENTNLATVPVKFAPAPFTNFTVVPLGPTAPGGIFYLPEESLAAFAGKNPFGQWRLEIDDTRAGATNPSPALLSWQLALYMADLLPTPVPLAPSAPATNLLGSGQIQSYEISVPNWAAFATNWLLSASAPVNLLFNSNAPPTGTNAGDLFLSFGSTGGRWIFRTNALPGLVPGSSYYLGIQNTNPGTVTLAFGVNFDVNTVVTLSSGIPYFSTNSGPLNQADFYRFVVTTNGVRAQFEINAPTGDLTLVARKGLPLPGLASYDFLSANPGTNDELIVVYDYSKPVGLSAGEWFLAAIDVTGAPASYSILATEFPDHGTNLVVSEPVISSNALCIIWDSLPGVHYFVEGKAALADPAWTRISPTLAAVDYSTTFCVALPSPYRYFRASEGLVLVPALPIITSFTFVTNGALLEWAAPTNVIFNVQWTPAPIAPNWRLIPGSITSTNGFFQFLDDGSQTGGLDGQRFYRLRQLP